MRQLCALCAALGQQPRPTGRTLGLRTSLPALIARAQERFDQLEGGDAHVVVPMCVEHVVDVYRGRVDGVSLAWRVPAALS